MKHKIEELFASNPALKRKVLIGLGVGTFFLVASMVTGDDDKAKKSLHLNEEIEQDIFRINQNGANFEKESLAGEITEVKEKVVKTDEELTSKVETLTSQVTKLSQIIESSANKDQVANQQLERALQEKLALFDRKIESKMRSANNAIHKVSKNLESKIESSNQPSRIVFDQPVDSTGYVYDPKSDFEMSFNSELDTSTGMAAESNSQMVITSFGDEPSDSGSSIEDVTDQIRSANLSLEEEKNNFVDSLLGEKPVQEIDNSTYIPAGTLLTGNLVTGVDMPTGSSSKDNPIPVMIRLSDEAILPNSHRVDFKGCVVIASGYGDISSERVMLRSNTVSCIREDGGAIEVPLKASVLSSTDGKVGIRGDLVSKSGDLIGRSMLAGTLGGLSKGLTPNPLSSFTSTGDDSQVFQYSNPSDVLTHGGLSGASEALSKIADYYIEIAEETRPIISLPPGVIVDLVMTSGISIKNR